LRPLELHPSLKRTMQMKRVSAKG